MEHTKEPWIFSVADDFHCGSIMGRHGGEVFDGDFTEANARRIVACVNACAGIPNEQLERGLPAMNALVDRIDGKIATLTKQRDDLLAALIRLRSFVGDPANFDAYGSDEQLVEFLRRVKREEADAILEADAAIAAANGE